MSSALRLLHSRRRLALLPCLLILLFPDAAAAFVITTQPSSSIWNAHLARHPRCRGQAARRLACARGRPQILVAALPPEEAAVVGEEFREEAGRAGLVEVRRAGPDEVKQLAWLVVNAFEEREGRDRVEGANQHHCLPCSPPQTPRSLSLAPSHPLSRSRSFSLSISISISLPISLCLSLSLFLPLPFPLPLPSSLPSFSRCGVNRAVPPTVAS